MAKGLQKSLQIYISKLKKITPHSQNLPNSPLSSTTTWFLSACKYPKTPSFSIDRQRSKSHDSAATLADVDRFLFENFNSLYAADDDDEDDNNNNNNNKEEEHNDEHMFASESPRFHKPPPSQRFFVCTGTSNSLMEEARSSLSAASGGDATNGLPMNSVAILRYTRDPYEEFRRSMQEMVEARQVGQRQPMDWEFLEDLLFSYLNLNEKRSHKYILGAFVDLMITSHEDSIWTQTTDCKIPANVRG